MKNRVAVAVAACLAIAAVSGCPAAPPTNPKTPVTAASKNPSPSPIASAALKADVGQSIMGTVKLPTGYNVISTGGGNFVSTNGGTVVPTGGGNVISTGGGNLRTVLKVDENVGAGAVVTLVDEDGDKVPGVAPVKADDDGNYAFSNVPAGTYLVEVETEKDKKNAKFDTIVEAGDTNADISAASTIVSAGVRENLDGDLDQLEVDSFETAVSKTAKSLDNAKLPDFTSDAAVLAKFDELSKEIAELKSLVEELSAKIDELTAKIEALTAQLSNNQTTGDCGMPSGLDANGDGSVSFEEFRIPPHETLTREQVFKHLDTNVDKKLVAAEFCKAPPPPGGGSTQQPPPPPGGTSTQPPPPGGCGPHVTQTFVITGYTPNDGDKLQALKGDGSLAPFSGTIQGGKSTFMLPSNCIHKFKIVGSAGNDLKVGTQTVAATGTGEITLTF